ncbi:MAG: NhaA family Na+:H+ antiporter [Gammaproteobacteria bacterium]|jgi:NhaA family Na+:H+ antiporter
MRASSSSGDRIHAPLEKTARTLAAPFRDFVATLSASGWVLLGATVLAVVLANSPIRTAYFQFLHLEFGLSLANHRFAMSLQHWMNDGLMALFFFLLGLELKRELLVGQLSDLRQAASVFCAALGGMAIPALVFSQLGSTDEILDGWAIPMATDTAFALVILVMLGDRIPASARAFLVGLAIVDDLGAILVIAFAYTTELDTAMLLPVAITFAVLLILNQTGVRSGPMYLLVGVVLWVLFTQMGLHGTLTGVVVALAAPVRPVRTRRTFAKRLKQKAERFDDEQDGQTDNITEQPIQQEIARDVVRVAEEVRAPLNRWETELQKPVTFVIMPLFAFMNAGINLSGDAIKMAWASELSAAIFVGLLVGKPVGILLGVWLGRVSGLVTLPDGLSWRHIIGIGLLGGIGFTMSIFIATLSVGDNADLLEIAKQSVIAASLCAGVLGYAWLRWACPASEQYDR